MLAIQTVAYTKVKKRDKCSFFTCNDMAICDLIIFNAYLLHYICVNLIPYTKRVQNIMTEYFVKVKKCMPELNALSKKCDRDIFTERLLYYNEVGLSISHEHSCELFISVDEAIEIFVPEFADKLKEILTYDFISQKYVTFSDSMPLLTLPASLSFKLNTEIGAYIQSFSTVFATSLEEAIAYMQ